MAARDRDLTLPLSNLSASFAAQRELRFDPSYPARGTTTLTDPYRTKEVIVRMSDLTMPRAMFDLAVVQYPGKLIMLCQKARILRRSDRGLKQLGALIWRNADNSGQSMMRLCPKRP